MPSSSNDHGNSKRENVQIIIIVNIHLLPTQLSFLLLLDDDNMQICCQVWKALNAIV